MADKRQVELDLFARDRATREIDNVGDSANRAGDKFRKMEGDANKLNARILESQQHIQSLAREISRTSDETERNNLFKKLRAEQTKMRRDIKVRDLLPSPGEFGKAGSDAGSATGRGMIAGLSDTLRATGPVGTAFAVGVGAQVATVAGPLIAAAVGGAILAGVGVGAIGIGAVLLREDPAVKAAAQRLGNTVVTTFTDAAQPLAEPLVQSLGIFEDSAKRIGPRLESMFAGAAPHVASLAKGIAGMAEKSMPGLEKALAASQPVLEAIGGALPGLGASISKFFDSIAKGGPGAAQGISDVIKVTGALVEATGALIEAGSDAYLMFRDFPAFSTKTVNGLMGVKNVMVEIRTPAEQLADVIHSQASALDIARLATEAFRREQEETTNANLSAAEAALAYRQAAKSAADAVDHKRRVSQQEEGALLSLARAGNADITVMENQNATGAQLSARHSKLRADFIATAIKMGYTKAEAKKLADQYLKIPKSVNTTAKLLGANAAISTAAALKRALDKLPKEKRIKLTVYQEGGDAGITVRTDKGGKARFADGGLFRGAGTTRSDSNLVRMSDKEFIVNADATARPGVLPLLEAINSGGTARPSGSSSLPAAPGLTEDGIFRAMVRALRTVPVMRVDTARTADLLARGG